MKIIERKPVPKNKYGRIILSGQNLEVHEKDTIFALASFGYDIETLIPSYIPKSHNPDLLMAGTTWEMKTTLSVKKKTIETKFRKAQKQSGGRSIFDLRKLRDKRAAIDYIIKLFQETRGMRRVIILEEDEKLLDIFK